MPIDESGSSLFNICHSKVLLSPIVNESRKFSHNPKQISNGLEIDFKIVKDYYGIQLEDLPWAKLDDLELIEFMPDN